jgi:hypothetical protein
MIKPTMTAPEVDVPRLPQMSADELAALAQRQEQFFTLLYSEGVATLAVTEFMHVLQEAWRRCAPVLVEQLAREVLFVEPRALSARFTTRRYDNGHFFDGDPDLTLVGGDVITWPSNTLLDDGLLATIGTCAGALRGQFMYLLAEDQVDDSPLSADDTLTLELASRRVVEWGVLERGS